MARVALPPRRSRIPRAYPERTLVRRYLVLFPCLLLAASCDDSADEVSHGPFRGLEVFCRLAGVNVSCTAFFAARDVTSEATWLASHSSLGSFVQPGLFVPTQRGDVGLSARYQGSSTLPSWFFVNPGEAARVLYFLNGVVRDEVTNAGLSGAEVRILDGHSAGLLAITNVVGVYRFEIGTILTGESFTIRASKVGYESVTKTHRVDYPQNTPGAGPPFLDFHLRRQG